MTVRMLLAVAVVVQVVVLKIQGFCIGELLMILCHQGMNIYQMQND